MDSNRKTGILCAMLEEVSGILKMVEDSTTTTIGCRTYHEGRINGRDVVVVFSRWGKVGAATTTTMLISRFNVTNIIFVGTAGAMAAHLRVGDVVVGKRFVQHDFNCAPILPKHELPFLGRVYLESSAENVRIAEAAVAKFLETSHFESCFSEEQRKEFNLASPRCYCGDIASGDTFFSSQKQKDELLNNFPSTLCVEMEGAAVAQVCTEYEIPLTVIRVISDSGDDNATMDFNKFIAEVAAKYSAHIVDMLVR